MRLPHAGRPALAAVLLTLALGLGASGAGGAAGTPSRATATSSPQQLAFRHYQTGHSDLAIELLEPYVKGGSVQGRALLQARELLARCYVRARRVDDAVGLFRVVLYQQPSYRPDSRLPADEREAFATALARHSAEIDLMTPHPPGPQTPLVSGPQAPMASVRPAPEASRPPASHRLASHHEPPPMPVSYPKASRAWMWLAAGFVLTAVGTALVVDGVGQE